MSKQSLTSKTLGGMFWIGGGVGIQAVSQVVFLMILARILTPSEYGIVTATAVLAGLGLVFSQIGVGPAIVQKEILTDLHVRAGLSVSMILAALIALLFNVFSEDISRLFRIEELKGVIPYLSLIYIFHGSSVPSESLLQRELKFNHIAMVDIVSYVFGYGVTGVLLAVNGYGYWSLVTAQIAQAAVRATLYLVVRPPLVMPASSLAPYLELLHFGIGVTVARIANYFAVQSDKVIISRYLGEDALGVYGRAYQLSVMPINLVANVLHTVTFPIISGIQSETMRVRRVFEKILVTASIVALPVSVILFILKDEIILIILGDQWLGVIPVFQILISGLLFRLTYRVAGSMLNALGKVYWRAFWQIIYALLVIVFSYIGVNYGASGVAFGVLIAGLFNALATVYLCMNETGHRWVEVIRFMLYGAKFTLVVSVPVMLVDLFVDNYDLPVILELIVLSSFWIVCVILVIRFIPKIVFDGVGLEVIQMVYSSLAHKLKRISSSCFNKG